MMKVDALSDVVTIKEFAQRSGYTERAVELWIAQDKIKSIYLEGLHRRLIPIHELERVIRDGNPGDRRRKKVATPA